jgi:hypothetical protein
MPLDIPAILDWANKVNTPEVQAMLQQYAITHKLTAEEINQLRDRINWILENFPAEFEPATADLADFLNESDNPFVRQNQPIIIQIPNISGTGIIGKIYQTPNGQLYTWNDTVFVAVSSTQKRKQTFSKDVYFAPVTGQDNIWFAPNYNGLIGTFGGINFNVNTLTSNLSVVRNNGLAPIVTVPYDCKVTNVFLDTIFGRQHLLEYGLIKFKRLNNGSSDLNVAINNLPIGVFPANGGVVMGNITAHQDNYDVSNSPIITKGEQIIPLIRRVSGALLNYVGVITITIEEI